MLSMGNLIVDGWRTFTGWLEKGWPKFERREHANNLFFHKFHPCWKKMEASKQTQTP